MGATVGKSAYGFIGPLPRQKRGGAVQHVQELIRDAIVRLDLPPGAFIDKTALCERLGVSRFPVSEALGRLAAEGLVEIQPQRGTLVARIRLSDVRESMFIRRALEAEAVRALASRENKATVGALQRNLKEQQSVLRRDDNAAFHALDLEFHKLLFDALGFERVRLAVEASRANLDRMRLFLCTPERKSATFAEHQAIVAALLCGDAAAAGCAMEAHLDAVMSELLTASANYPEAFEAAETEVAAE
jgi:GntR family transcriptional regulator, rspAB operon transcriptional repressor